MHFSDLHTDPIPFFERILFEAVGVDVRVSEYQFLSGGCINNAVRVDTDQGNFFVKWNETAPDDAFACEAKGLELLRNACELRVPAVVSYGRQPQRSYLILEYIQSSQPAPNYWAEFAVTLARLHAHTNAYFGLEYDNYIGSLRQSNALMPNWVDFFVEKRLKVQAGLALYNHHIPQSLYDRFEQLYEKLPGLLPDEKPALLHGDLWHGNVMVGNTGLATLIDPAVYYGHREAELAMTRLFGGFPPEFYGVYAQISPLAPGFDERVDLYNLYPLLVHVNLFGSGYLSGVERVLAKYA